MIVFISLKLIACRICVFQAVSFRGPNLLKPRPDWSPLGVTKSLSHKQIVFFRGLNSKFSDEHPPGGDESPPPGFLVTAKLKDQVGLHPDDSLMVCQATPREIEKKGQQVRNGFKSNGLKTMIKANKKLLTS